MFKKTILAAVSAVALLSAAVPANATWYLGNAGCKSLEQFQLSLGTVPTWHTPNDLISVGLAIDVTEDWAAKMPPELNLDDVRMMDFGGPHGLHFLTKSLPICRLWASTMPAH